ncbi:Nudix family hydrolase [uncultured Thiodictyon sp.]|uniref:Nudix family hydrolase n=1 Tax=uncultured Thiodictyon sp. TaxID=1846217 RepID=UPI0025E4EAF6|nr:Nudix family hydrolase [uncultured Thiodictyon sp.]
MSSKQIHVMAGVLQDAEGRVLVTRRPEAAHQGGLWEFPGGKLEPGETPEQGLSRELAEELGIEIHTSRPLIRVHHDYGDRHILLDVRRVVAHAGTPHGREGQPLDWLAPNAMDPTRFPAADRPIIMALRLPQRLLITGADPRDPATLLARLRRVLEAGIRLVQLRAHELDDAAYRDLAGRAFPLCAAAGARLLLNRDPVAVADCPCHGLHLTAHRLAALQRRPGAPDELVGASCHNAAELSRAAALGLDYALLSPVKPTATHPQARALGWPGFAALVDPIPLPVYALGGLTTTDLSDAIGHGAQGVAAIRGLWPN